MSVAIVPGATEFALHGELERLLDIGILGNVCANKGGGAAVLYHRRGNVRAFLFATAGEDHFCAHFGKGQRRSFADTGGSSGNENDFVSIRVLHSR